ncbi:MCE family protein [Dietzia sp.]|uniref:MCE family protein n=1 Tax=Dietzia sp. TaxID=1871616 RepID=UPI002FDB7E70
MSVAKKGQEQKNSKAPRGALRFRDRDPKLIGILGIAICVVLVVVSSTYNKVGWIMGTHTATAYVADAAGLKVGDEVHVAGMRVGTVRDLKIDGGRVKVDFDIDRDVELGSDTRAQIKTDSLLGRRALAVFSNGKGELPDRTIPFERTSTPYSLTDALGDVSKTVDELDTDKVSDALGEISKTLDAAGPETRGALDGITRLSKTLNDRDTQLRELLQKASESTDVLGQRADQFNKVVNDGNTLFAALDARKRAIADLIRNVDSLSIQLSGLVQDNEAQLGPTLEKVDKVSDLLIRNKDDIDMGIRRMNPYATALGEAVASGPWFNAYISNLSLPQYPQSVVHDLAPLLDPNLGTQPDLEREPTMPGAPGLNLTDQYPNWGEDSNP